jgi:hypothetical protein
MYLHLFGTIISDHGREGFVIAFSQQKSVVLLLAVVACVFSANAQQPIVSPLPPVSTQQVSNEIRSFLGREVAAHVADIHSLDPPQERVVGALTTGEFSWGTFMRTLAIYSVLSGERRIAGRDIPELIGQMGLIEAKNGGKSFAQLYAALALRQFGTELAANQIWQSLAPEQRNAWRSLLDPARFYDQTTRKVINLPENYFGVAARIAAMDAQLGFIADRGYVNDVLDRAADQFTKGNLYADDAFPTGRFDRYSNEYARYVYEAAQDAGRQDLMAALAPSLKAQMRTWWDLLAADGYSYPWGRSLGAISYMDTIEIVAFVARYPEFRPAPLPQLASAYYAAWQWLKSDFQPERHLLNVFGYGRGNYDYINPQREWQQTTGFFGKVSNSQYYFEKAMQQENITSFAASLVLPEVARFEYFRKKPRPAGVWLVRRGGLRFALPITTGAHPGVADYLSAPYGLPGFAAPVEQFVPVLTPYLELDDGRVLVASDLADEITPSPDGLSLSAVWRQWAVVAGKTNEHISPGLTTVVTWRILGDSLVRTETISASQPVRLRSFSVVVPSTGQVCATHFTNSLRTDRCDSPEGSWEVTVKRSDWPLHVSLRATGDTALNRGNRGALPLYLEFESSNVELRPGQPMHWEIQLRAILAGASGTGGSRNTGLPTLTTNPDSDYLH